MVAAGRGVEVGEDPPQGGLAQPADRARGQPQPVLALGDVALAFDLALDIAQPQDVRPGGRPQTALHTLEMEKKKGRAGV
ncbi:MAG: hypothetical protein ACTHJ6_16975, partial [Oryzihumus sp.]